MQNQVESLPYQSVYLYILSHSNQEDTLICSFSGFVWKLSAMRQCWWRQVNIQGQVHPHQEQTLEKSSVERLLRQKRNRTKPTTHDQALVWRKVHDFWPLQPWAMVTMSDQSISLLGSFYGRTSVISQLSQLCQKSYSQLSHRKPPSWSLRTQWLSHQDLFIKIGDSAM